MQTGGPGAPPSTQLATLVSAEHGTLSFIDNAVDTTTGTIALKAVFDNVNEHLWPGQFVKASLTLRVEPNALVIPTQAVQVGQNGAYVFVVENGVAKLRPVTIDRTVDMQSVITNGLTGGETVVLDGQLTLVDGVRVAPRSGAKAGT